MMNCNTFRSRMQEYMEGGISYDLKLAMDRHLMQCEKCSTIYKQECSGEDAFRDYFELDGVSLNRISDSVMKNIDKAKYKNPGKKKLYYSFRTNSGRYLTAACLFLAIVVIAPIILQDRDYFKLNPKTTIVQNQDQSKDNGVKFAGAPEENASADAKAKDSSAINNLIVNKKLIKTSMDKAPDFHTPWKSYSDGTLSACVEGKSEDAQEEGIGYIVLYDKATNKYVSFKEDAAENSKQFTPMKVEWWDAKNLLVTYGLAYGTLSFGGDLYLLNIEDGSFIPVYERNNDKLQVTNVVKKDNELMLNMLIYDDNAFMKSHGEKWKITGFDASFSKPYYLYNEKGEKLQELNSK